VTFNSTFKKKWNVTACNAPLIFAPLSVCLQMAHLDEVPVLCSSHSFVRSVILEKNDGKFALAPC
jgi:hypothetical protein